MSQLVYYPGGVQLEEQWDDTTSTYTRFNPDGTVAESRPYTAQEIAAAVVAATATTAAGNGSTLRQQAQNALTANRVFINATKPGTAATVASAAYDQAVALSRQNNGIIRLLLGQLDATN